MPLVSVIIPNYNHSRYLHQRINSVLTQSFQDFELILLDDASTDDSITLLEQYRKHEKVAHLIYNDLNSGSTFKQWDKGVSLARGKYIWLAESDDRCESNFLQELLQLHKTYDIGIAYCKSLPIDKDDLMFDKSDSWMKRIDPVRWEHDYFNLGYNECENYMCSQCTIPNASAVLFRTDALRQIDFGTVDYKVCGDWLIYAQILKNYNLAYTVKTRNYHRSHADNARGLYRRNVLPEQLKVMEYIASHFKVKKGLPFKKSLDEKIDNYLSAIKHHQLSAREIREVFRSIVFLDTYYFLRLLTVILNKALGRRKPFESNMPDT